MLAAFSFAVRDAFAEAQRRSLRLSLLITIVVLAALWIAASALFAATRVSGLIWLDTMVHVLGSIAALFVAWALFPAVSMLVLGFFLDGIVAAIERAHYPELPPARRIGIATTIASALRLAVVAVAVNLVLLPLYLVPGVNIVVYYGLNGYLVGREYFEPIAFRRLDRRGVRALWRSNRAKLVVAGVIIVFLLSLPFIDLAAPLIGAAFMLHLFEAMRRAAAAAEG